MGRTPRTWHILIFWLRYLTYLDEGQVYQQALV